MDSEPRLWRCHDEGSWWTRQACYATEVYSDGNDSEESEAEEESVAAMNEDANRTEHRGARRSHAGIDASFPAKIAELLFLLRSKVILGKKMELLDPFDKPITKKPLCYLNGQSRDIHTLIISYFSPPQEIVYQRFVTLYFLFCEHISPTWQPLQISLG